ncbi:MAG: DnaD domain protein, partial [bacterium]
ITQRGKNETNLYFLPGTRNTEHRDTKKTSHKEFKDFNKLINNNKKNINNQSVNKFLSKQIMQAFTQSFNHKINNVQANTLNNYINKFNLTESLIITIIKEDGLGNNTSKFFFNHLELLKEKNIKTVEQYKQYKENKNNNNNISYINDYRKTKQKKKNLMDDENIKKIQELIEKKYNQKINYNTIRGLILKYDLIKIIKTIPIALNYNQLQKKLNYSEKNKRKNFKKNLYR